MLTTLRDARGRIQAAMAWHIVDDHGYTSNYGRYCFIDQLEISKGADGVPLIRQLIDLVAKEYDWLVGAFWNRRDKTGMKQHGFRRDQLLKQAEREVADGRG